MDPLLSSPVNSLVGISLLVIELSTVRSGPRSTGKKGVVPAWPVRVEQEKQERQGGRRDTAGEGGGGRSEPSGGLRTTGWQCLSPRPITVLSQGEIILKGS